MYIRKRRNYNHLLSYYFKRCFALPATFYTNNEKDASASLNVLLNKGLKGLVLYSE